jgi:hypothetical protein
MGKSKGMFFIQRSSNPSRTQKKTVASQSSSAVGKEILVEIKEVILPDEESLEGTGEQISANIKDLNELVASLRKLLHDSKLDEGVIVAQPRSIIELLARLNPNDQELFYEYLEILGIETEPSESIPIGYLDKQKQAKVTFLPMIPVDRDLSIDDFLTDDIDEFLETYEEEEVEASTLVDDPTEDIFENGDEKPYTYSEAENMSDQNLNDRMEALEQDFGEFKTEINKKVDSIKDHFDTKFEDFAKQIVGEINLYRSAIKTYGERADLTSERIQTANERIGGAMNDIEKVEDNVANKVTIRISAVVLAIVGLGTGFLYFALSNLISKLP